MTEIKMFKVGDEVAVDDPKWAGIWRVEKVNPTTYKLAQEGNPRGLKAHHWLVREVTEADRDPNARPVFTPFELYVAGELVRVKGDPRIEGPHVVLKQTREKVQIAKLGGDDDRYWSVAPQHLIRVSLEELGL